MLIEIKADRSPDDKQLPLSMDTRNYKGITSTLPASLHKKGIVMWSGEKLGFRFFYHRTKQNDSNLLRADILIS